MDFAFWGEPQERRFFLECVLHTPHNIRLENWRDSVVGVVDGWWARKIIGTPKIGRVDGWERESDAFSSELMEGRKGK